MTKSRHLRAPRRCWTAEELVTLRREYPDRLTADIARDLGRKVHTVHAKARKIGLTKSDVFWASDKAHRIQRGKRSTAMTATQFKHGGVPANKGLRRPGWHAGRMRETQFKSRRPEESSNYLPIGSLKLNHDGALVRKITDDRSIVPARRWVAVARLVWEDANGPVPPGHNVVFKQGRRTTDPEKITLDAIECISNAELGRRNVMWNRYPKEVAQVMQLRGAVNRQIRRKARDARNQDAQ